jgi:hypothetical protein
MLQPLLFRLRQRYKTSAGASGGPAGSRRVSEEKQLGRCAAEQSKYNRFCLISGIFTLAAMYFRRVLAAGRTTAAAQADVYTVVTPPLPEARNLGLGLRLPYRGKMCG